MNSFLIIFGKIISRISSAFNLGSGSTWPGHIALSLNKNFIKEVIEKNKELKIILIAGTNGKTTTEKLIKTILEGNLEKVFQNESGANLLNGIASSLIGYSDLTGKIDYNFAIFEIDENTFPFILEELTPNFVILLNLFRDQLDRYGEVDTIAKKWKRAVDSLPQSTILILNADDPQIAFLGKDLQTRTFYFGLNENLKTPKDQETLDTNYCPNCNSKLQFKTINFSHLGNWECPFCKLKRPRLDIENIDYCPLPGIYNRYNSLAAVLSSRVIGVSNQKIISGLKKFIPAFGRQEVIEIDDKKVRIFLSKNPTSFNESLRTVQELGAKTLLFVLNDRIPDGRDISWIWDVNLERVIDRFKRTVISGDRALDMGLRLKYSIQNAKFPPAIAFGKSRWRAGKMQNYNSKFKIIENLKDAVKESLSNLGKNEILYILPTYSAMLEVRKILTGRKIL